MVLDIIKIMAMAMDHMMGRLGRREIVFPLKPTLVVALLTGEEVGLPPKKEKKESKKMLNLRRDTKPDFFHIVGNSQKNGKTSSTGKLFRGTELTMHRRGF